MFKTSHFERMRQSRSNREISYFKLNSKLKRIFYTNILTNANRHTVLYVGVTNGIRKRIAQHKENKRGFAYRYNCFKLVYLEEFTSPQVAIDREKQIKRWSRSKKEKLIESINPDWEDLLDSF